MATLITFGGWEVKYQREPVVYPAVGVGAKRLMEHLVLKGIISGNIEGNGTGVLVSAQHNFPDRGIILSAQSAFEVWTDLGDPLASSLHSNLYLDGCSFFEHMTSRYEAPTVGQAHYYSHTLVREMLRMPFDDESYMNMRLSSDNKQAGAVNVTCTVIVHVIKED